MTPRRWGTPGAWPAAGRFGDDLLFHGRASHGDSPGRRGIGWGSQEALPPGCYRHALPNASNKTCKNALPAVHRKRAGGSFSRATMVRRLAERSESG
jgi:hypothetical protein